jgi:hypothetical protein
MGEPTRLEHDEADRQAARRNYVVFCAMATATMAAAVGGVIALFLQ